MYDCPVQHAPLTYKFTGKEHDSESGLDNFGARYEASSMGRFMSPDWSSAPMGVPFAGLDDPQTLNLYAYVGNNPVTSVDPDGHCEGSAWITSPCGGQQCPDADPFKCTVTADPPQPEPVVQYSWRVIWENAGRVAGRAQDLLHTAWDFWRTTKPDPGCLAASTGAFAAAGAGFGFDAGAAGGGALGLGGGPAAPITVPLGAGGGGAAGAFLGGAGGAALGNLVGQVACRVAGPGGGGGGSGRGSAGRTSPNQMNQQVQRGQAPDTVDRVDSARFPHEQPHIEFKDGNALNIDGTWKHGGRALTNTEANWITSNGWSLPR